MHVKYIDCVVFGMIRCNNFTYIIPSHHFQLRHFTVAERDTHA